MPETQCRTFVFGKTLVCRDCTGGVPVKNPLDPVPWNTPFS